MFPDVCTPSHSSIVKSSEIPHITRPLHVKLFQSVYGFRTLKLLLVLALCGFSHSFRRPGDFTECNITLRVTHFKPKTPNECHFLKSGNHPCERLSDWRVSCASLFQFIIEDMKQQQTNKHSNLHREDQHITVEELWKGWKTSEGETQERDECYGFVPDAFFI